MSSNNGDPKRNRGKTLSRLFFDISKSEHGTISLAFVALAVNARTNLYFSWIMGKAVDYFNLTKSSSSSNRNNLPYYVGGIFAAGTIASWIRVYCLGLSTDRIAIKLRKLLFESYMDKDSEYFDTTKTGELITTLDDDVESASEVLTETMSKGLRSMNSAIFGSISLLYNNSSLCVVSLSVVPIVGVGAMIIHKLARACKENLRILRSDVLNYTIERFSCMNTVKLNGREDTEINTYDNYLNQCLKLSNNAHMMQGTFMSFINLSTNVSLLAVLYTGGYIINQGELTAGGLTQFALQSGSVALGFSGLSTFYSDMIRSLDAAGRVFAIIDENNSQKQTKNNTKKIIMKTINTIDKNTENTMSSISSTRLNLPQITNENDGGVGGGPGVLSVFQVYYTYPSRDIPILNNLTFTTAPFTITAIRGRSGSGKSTILNLITGLYRPQSGVITLDNDNIETSYNLRQAIGVVQQEENLFSGSIYQVISYGAGAVEFSTIESERKAIEDAAKLAGAHAFIMKFPEGYNTNVGSRGSLLSGGQKARIAIARALVRQPRLLVLDEATSGLDIQTEKQLLSTLQTLVAGGKPAKRRSSFEALGITPTSSPIKGNNSRSSTPNKDIDSKFNNNSNDNNDIDVDISEIDTDHTDRPPFKCSVIMFTHSEQVLRSAHNVYVLNEGGQLVEEVLG